MLLLSTYTLKNTMKNTGMTLSISAPATSFVLMRDPGRSLARSIQNLPDQTDEHEPEVYEDQKNYRRNAVNDKR